MSDTEPTPKRVNELSGKKDRIFFIVTFLIV
jgi:hypothetical protein